MLVKKIIGIIIIGLNLGGVVFLIYGSVAYFLSNRQKKEKTPPAHPMQRQGKAPVSGNQNQTRMILEKEDDLLKDMDLSDLDDLDLDDFD